MRGKVKSTRAFSRKINKMLSLNLEFYEVDKPQVHGLPLFHFSLHREGEQEGQQEEEVQDAAAAGRGSREAASAAAAASEEAAAEWFGGSAKANKAAAAADRY